MDFSNIINVVLTALVGLIAFWAFREQKRATYMQFYEIVARHHGEEITDLRREVMTKLPEAAERARALGKTLFEIDPALQLKTSTLANYYEGMGTFLKGGWNIFPEQARNAMLEMLHNSVSKTWPVIEKYRDEIYPKQKRPPDWAGSYRWLHEKVVVYRKEHGLDVAPGANPAG